jgi:hypothetical protein
MEQLTLLQSGPLKTCCGVLLILVLVLLVFLLLALRTAVFLPLLFSFLALMKFIFL